VPLCPREIPILYEGVDLCQTPDDRLPPAGLESSDSGFQIFDSKFAGEELVWNLQSGIWNQEIGICNLSNLMNFKDL
jgi:hypothetical protein